MYIIIPEYFRNVKQVSKINWAWNNGKTTTEIKYIDGEVQNRNNNEAPPTKACHDIAHFMAAFNGNMELDYLQPINHLPEYNAVFIENILTKICFHKMNNLDFDVNPNMENVLSHMRWFCEDYYFISKNHPTKKGYRQLFDEFLSVWEVEKTLKFFDIFYEIYFIEKNKQSKDFEVDVVMSLDSNFYDDKICDMIYKSKKSLRNFL